MKFLNVSMEVSASNVICRSVPFLRVEVLYSRCTCGKEGIGDGTGVDSFPMDARPWYADTKRLYPLMWVSALKGGRLDLTFFARAFHWSCVSWASFPQALMALLCTHSWSIWFGVPGKVGLGFVL